jgi:hypothetical protein
MDNFQSDIDSSDRDEEKKETLEEQIDYPSSLTKDLDSLKKGLLTNLPQTSSKKRTIKEKILQKRARGSPLFKAIFVIMMLLIFTMAVNPNKAVVLILN